MRSSIALLGTLASFVLHAQTPSWDWVYGSGGEHKDDGKSVAIAPDGSVYELGVFQSDSITLGDTTLYNPIEPDHNMFLAKYTPDGELLWAKMPTGLFYGCIPEAMTVDQEGNVIVAGAFNGYNIRFGELQINGGNVTSDTEILIVKLDADGNGIWGYSQGGVQATNSEYITDVRTDSQGNVFALGNTHSASINFDGTVYENLGPNMLFILKFSPTGEMLDVATSYSQCTHSSYSMGLDEFGNVYIGGSFFNTNIRFGQVQVPTAGVNDEHAFLFKFDNELQPLWAQTIGGYGDDDVYGVALDGNGHLYVVGRSTSGTVSTNGMSAPNPYEEGGMVAQYDLEGVPQWIRVVGDSIAAWEVEADADHVYVMANFTTQLPVEIGNDTLQSTGPYQICLFALGADGTHQWAEGILGTRTHTGDLAVASPTDIYVTGMYAFGDAFFGPLDLPMEAQEETYFTDVFFARLHVDELNVGISTPSAHELSIFPVPASDQLALRSAVGPLLDVELLDASGRIVLRIPANGEATMQMDVSGLQAGNYVLRSRTHAGVRHAVVSVVR